jgi:hypothetical protein
VAQELERLARRLERPIEEMLETAGNISNPDPREGC